MLKRFLLHVSNCNDVFRNEVDRSLTSIRSTSKVLIVGCTESVDGLESSLLNSFEEKICLPTTISSSVEEKLSRYMEGLVVCFIIYIMNCV